VGISFTDFHPNRSVAVDSTDINSPKALKQWDFDCADFHPTHNIPATLMCGDFLYRVSPVSIKTCTEVAVINSFRPLSKVELSLR
jgi:hypothetical protein